jgi:glycosyltransferase involved in cell wall biosynthesis
VRIALIDPGAYTPPYDNRLAAALARRGHEVDLLTAPFRFGETPRVDGYRRDELFFPLSSRVFRRAPRARVRLVLKALEYAPDVARLLRRLESVDPDVVHVQWLVRPETDLLWLRRVRAKRPVVFTAHGFAGMLASRGAGWRRVLESVDRVVVHSRRALDELAALGVEQVVRIPHAVFEPSAAPSPPEGTTLLSLGLIRPYKGLDLLIRALPAIARGVPDVRLVVAGDAMMPVEPLRQLAAEEGVAHRVDWQLGFLSEAEVQELLRAAAAVVLPYRHRIDASGVLALALGAGRPAVVSDVGSLGETISEFGAGEVVPPEDVEALAAACARLLANPQQPFQGALAARTALTWDAAAEAHEQLYEQVSNRSLSPG